MEGGGNRGHIAVFSQDSMPIGEATSTRSDWHFTAFKDSSENYATFTRSIHYNLVLERSPSFGSNRSNLSITNFFYVNIFNNSPVAFAKAFNLATSINLLTHYAKGTSSFLFKISTAYRVTNSRLFHQILILIKIIIV